MEDEVALAIDQALDLGEAPHDREHVVVGRVAGPSDVEPARHAGRTLARPLGSVKGWSALPEDAEGEVDGVEGLGADPGVVVVDGEPVPVGASVTVDLEGANLGGGGRRG